MRYMMMFRADKKSEAGVAPSVDEMNAMGTLIGEMASTGVLLSTEGLEPSSKGALISLFNGKLTVADGPIDDPTIAGFALIQVNNKREAIEWAKRGLQALGSGRSEVREVSEMS